MFISVPASTKLLRKDMSRQERSTDGLSQLGRRYSIVSTFWLPHMTFQTLIDPSIEAEIGKYKLGLS